MTALRQRMIEDMRVRNYSPRTVEAYVAVAKLAKHFRRSPDQLGAEELRAFQVHLLAQPAASARARPPSALRGCKAWSSTRRCGRAIPARCGCPGPSPKGAWRRNAETSQHNAHSSPVRICYRHHPFFNHEGHIVRRFRRRAEDSYVVELSDGVVLAMPAWMLDAAVCDAMRMEARPRIAVSSLLDLCRLLDALPTFAAVDSTSKGGLPDAAVETPFAIPVTTTPVCGREPGRAVESLESGATGTVPEPDQSTSATDREPTRQPKRARRKEQP